MRTEEEVSRSWRELFRRPEISSDCMLRAEALLDSLSPESPLRHRLGMELDELRRLRLQTQ